jgi:hypothetical protein
MRKRYIIVFISLCTFCFFFLNLHLIPSIDISRLKHNKDRSQIEIHNHHGPTARSNQFITGKSSFIEKKAQTVSVPIVEKSEPLVPWDELNENWMNELKELLLSIDNESGHKMFRAYLNEKKQFNKRTKQISEKLHKLFQDEIKNELLIKKLQDKSSYSIENHRLRIKKIFGQHYNDVKKHYIDYEASIQVYARSHALTIDIGFLD